MAKRKAAAGRTRKTATNRSGAAASRKTTRKSARPAARAAKSDKGAKAGRTTARQASARKSSGRKTPLARKTARTAKASRSAATRKTSARPARAATPRAKAKAPARTMTAARGGSKALPPKKVPALNRARRTVPEEEVMVPSPPSSLDLDRSASAVRSGRKEIHEKLDELTQTGPALTGGDVDADFESAYSVGDEAPGGDNPTPDQDIVDDIGRAVGVEYEDNEELKGEGKIAKRDRHRWELDPASSEDYNDR
jgi:hypothetical protein